jgi:hypothetical protein
MRFTVNLNRNPPLEAGEVDHIAGERKLSTKSQSARALPELLPQRHFGKTQLTPESTSRANILGRSTHSPVAGPSFDPSTMLRMVPLPVPGRI